MKGKRRFFAALAANLSLVLLCLLWRWGVYVSWMLLPALLYILHRFNAKTAASEGEVHLLGISQVLVTVIVHLYTGFAYNLAYDQMDNIGYNVGFFILGILWAVYLWEKTKARYDRAIDAEKMRRSWKTAFNDASEREKRRDTDDPDAAGQEGHLL